MQQLKSERSIDEYFNENDKEDIFFGDLPELLNFFMAKKKLKKKQVIEKSQIKREYCYEILAGKTKKHISRDRVIQLCFGLDLDIDEAQQLLKKSGHAPLYARDTRDAIIIFSIVNRLSVLDTNHKLDDYALPLLFEEKEDRNT